MQIGDMVRVLVSRDILDDQVDTNAIYKIESFDRTDNSVWIERVDGEIVNDVNVWNVYRWHVESTTEHAMKLREQLVSKMEQLNHLQREIAKLESELGGETK